MARRFWCVWVRLVLAPRGVFRRSSYGKVGLGVAWRGSAGRLSRGKDRNGKATYVGGRRSWLGAARSGIAWSGPVGLGMAVVATCDKARLGWQGWAVMLGRGLIGVRKARRSGFGRSVGVWSGRMGQGKAVMAGQYQSSSGVFGSGMARRLWLGTALQVSARCGSVRNR